MTVDVLRPDQRRFASLPDFDFAPQYLDVDGVRIHYLDEGAGPPVVLYHGEPTWSFLYRKIIPVLVAAGYRAIAPDYPGFGKSDTPVDPGYYSYDRHVGVIGSLIEHLDLTDATAVVHDWGGPIGLRLAVEMDHRFRRLVITNTAVSNGTMPPPAFMAWRQFVEATPNLPIGMIMQRAGFSEWPQNVIDAYAAPFPDAPSKIGAYLFPLLVPTGPDDVGAREMLAVREALSRWTDPALVLFGTADPVFTVSFARRWIDRIPGADELILIDEAAHFVQEDQGDAVAAHIATFLGATD